MNFEDLSESNQNIVRDIRKKCRLAMNGVVSSDMRDRGLHYKINFGLLQNQIKDIAKCYQSDLLLAEYLWSQDTRELKIISTMLCPCSQITEETADRWCSNIPNQEIREQICLNLFQNLPYAFDKAMDWSTMSNLDIRTTGYWLLVRLLLLKRSSRIVEAGDLPLLFQDILAENVLLRNASLLLIKHIGRQDKEYADELLCLLQPLKDSKDQVQNEIYENIFFEFDFYFG